MFIAREPAMRIFRIIVVLAALLTICGCQNMGHTQFAVPLSKEKELIAALQAIALANGMTDKTSTSSVPDTLVYWGTGDIHHFTDLGARKYGDQILVDLNFRIAGTGGDSLYRKLSPQVENALRTLYGNSVRIERDRSKIIPMHAKSPNAAQDQSNK
jgi:hypothetical protein